MSQQNQEPMLFGRGVVLGVVLFVGALCCLVIRGFLEMSGAGQTSVRVLVVLFELLFVGGISITCVYVLIYLNRLYRHNESMVGDLRRLTTSQTHNEAILTQINENILLSDAIKSVAFRENDRNVLESAIQQDIRRELWDSAALLIDELENRFGCRGRAKQLREEMDKHRNASEQEKIDSCIGNIESLWMIHNYDQAQKEVDSLMKMYPHEEKIQSLSGQTELRREKHKKELLEQWDAAVKANDIDHGVEILKFLDGYLEPAEAAALEESARGVFRAKLHNMGVQFSLFVTGRKWEQALKVGRQIVLEYPNSRMAQEVRERMSALEERAGSSTDSSSSAEALG